MGGFVVKNKDNLVRLQPEDLLKLFDTNLLSQPESIESDIHDRSKADWILKSLALLQVVWFITQVIGRVVQGLSVSTLELFTLGTISCALVVYLIWWEKPFDIRRPTIIELKKSLPGNMFPIRRVNMIRKEAVHSSNRAFIVAACATLVFGALHLAGWNFHFPTETERWMWRAASIGCVVLPLLVLADAVFLDDRHDDDVWYICSIFAVFGLYIICRLYMMVEMFASLRAVPADVYKTPQWSQYIPSFG